MTTACPRTAASFTSDAWSGLLSAAQWSRIPSWTFNGLPSHQLCFASNSWHDSMEAHRDIAFDDPKDERVNVAEADHPRQDRATCTHQRWETSRGQRTIKSRQPFFWPSREWVPSRGTAQRLSPSCLARNLPLADAAVRACRGVGAESRGVQLSHLALAARQTTTSLTAENNVFTPRSWPKHTRPLS